MVNQSPPQSLDFFRFHKLLKVCVGLSFFIIAFGSLVRAASAGLACPDWPLCFGKLIPHFDYQIFLEWFHRLLAGGLTLTLLLGSISLVKKPLLRRAFGLQLTVTLCLLAIQVVLGGLTVLHLLEARTVAAHLINALLFFSVLLWMTLRARQIGHILQEGTKDITELSSSQQDLALSKGSNPLKKLKVTAAIFCIVLFAQLAVGGMVSTNYAGLACPDIPKCHGEWIPPPIFHMWLQVIHRFLGVSVTLLGGLLCYFGVRSLNHSDALLEALTTCPPQVSRAFKRERRIHRVMVALPLMLIFQILLGVINVLYFLPTSITVLHLANGVAIYGLTLLVVVYLYEPSFQNDWHALWNFLSGSKALKTHSSLSQAISPTGKSQRLDPLSPKFES